PFTILSFVSSSCHKFAIRKLEHLLHLTFTNHFLLLSGLHKADKRSLDLLYQFINNLVLTDQDSIDLSCLYCIWLDICMECKDNASLSRSHRHIVLGHITCMCIYNIEVCSRYLDLCE